MKKAIITLLTLATLTAFSSKNNKINNAKIIYCMASSTLEPFSGRYSVNKLFDGNVKTCWSEGFPGTGIGTRIMIHFDKVVTINKLYIVNGLGISKYHKKNNRVKQLRINRQLVTLKDTKAGKYQTVALPNTIKSRLIIIEIVSIYKTSKWNDTCISEISLSPDKKAPKTARLTTRGDQFLIGNWGYEPYNMYRGYSEYIQFYANHTFTSSKQQVASATADAVIEYQDKGRWKRVGNTIYMTITKIIKYKYMPAAGKKHRPPKEKLLGTYTLRIGDINTLHSDQGYAFKNQDRKF